MLVAVAAGSTGSDTLTLARSRGFRRCAMEPKTLHKLFLVVRHPQQTGRRNEQNSQTTPHNIHTICLCSRNHRPRRRHERDPRGSHKRDGCSPTRQALPHHGRAPSACEQMCRRGRCRAAPRSAGRPMGATRQSARPGPAHEARRASSLLGSARNAPSLSSCRSARTPPPPL